MLVFFPQQIVTKENREEDVCMICMINKGLLCLWSYKQKIATEKMFKLSAASSVPHRHNWSCLFTLGTKYGNV